MGFRTEGSPLSLRPNSSSSMGCIWRYGRELYESETRPGYRKELPRMNKLGTIVLGLLSAAALVACADNNGDADRDSPGTLIGPSSGVGPGISVGEAIASDLDGPFLVNGFIFITGGEHDDPEQVRLCEALAESFPPQCSGESLVVEGLDIKALLVDLTSEGPVSWTAQPVQLLGEVDGGTLILSQTAR